MFLIVQCQPQEEVEGGIDKMTKEDFKSIDSLKFKKGIKG